MWLGVTASIGCSRLRHSRLYGLGVNCLMTEICTNIMPSYFPLMDLLLSSFVHVQLYQGRCQLINYLNLHGLEGICHIWPSLLVVWFIPLFDDPYISRIPNLKWHFEGINPRLIVAHVRYVGPSVNLFPLHKVKMVQHIFKHLCTIIHHNPRMCRVQDPCPSGQGQAYGSKFTLFTFRFCVIIQKQFNGFPSNCI